jgi:hypothetical protein
MQHLGCHAGSPTRPARPLPRLASFCTAHQRPRSSRSPRYSCEHAGQRPASTENLRIWCNRMPFEVSGSYKRIQTKKTQGKSMTNSRLFVHVTGTLVALTILCHRESSQNVLKLHHKPRSIVTRLIRRRELFLDKDPEATESRMQSLQSPSCCSGVQQLEGTCYRTTPATKPDLL